MAPPALRPSKARAAAEVEPSRVAGGLHAAKPVPGAEEFVPRTASPRRLAAAANDCRGCPLYRNATQAVFGEGARASALFLVGEQPGDQEDREGRPFVGPAGTLLDRALAEAGVKRREVYVTNVVKHFKFEPRGKRRIHQTPNSAEVEACRPWLLRELELVRPELVVCLGATASKAFFGSGFRLTRSRGRVLESPLAPRVLATIHPSAALRAPDETGRRRMFAALVRDLRAAALAARAVGRGPTKYSSRLAGP